MLDLSIINFAFMFWLTGSCGWAILAVRAKQPAALLALLGFAWNLSFFPEMVLT